MAAAPSARVRAPAPVSTTTQAARDARPSRRHARRLHAFEHLHDLGLAHAERHRPPLERFAARLHEHDRSSGVIDHGRHGNDRCGVRSLPSAAAETRTVRAAASTCGCRTRRQSAACVSRDRELCRASSRALESERPRGPRFRSRPPSPAAPARPAIPESVRRRGPGRHRPPRRAWCRPSHSRRSSPDATRCAPRDRRAKDEESARATVACAADARRCTARSALLPRAAARGPALRPRALRRGASAATHRRSPAARRARDRARRDRRTPQLPRAPVRAAAARRAPTAAAAIARVPVPASPRYLARPARPESAVHRSAPRPARHRQAARRSRPAPGSIRVSRAPPPATVPKSSAHCCSLRKLMPSASAGAASTAFRAACLIGMHRYIGNAMGVCERRRLERDHEFARAGARRLDVDAEDAGPRWRIDAECLRCRAAALQPHLDLPRRHRLEIADVRQMDGEPRRLPDDQRRILGKQLRLVGPPRHARTARARLRSVAAGSSPPHALAHIANSTTLNTLKAISCLLRRARARFARGGQRAACRWRGCARARPCDAHRAARECRLRLRYTKSSAICVSSPAGDAASPVRMASCRSASTSHVAATCARMPCVVSARSASVRSRSASHRAASRTPESNSGTVTLTPSTPPLSRPATPSARFTPPTSVGAGSFARRAASASRRKRSDAADSARSSPRVVMARR